MTDTEANSLFGNSIIINYHLGINSPAPKPTAKLIMLIMESLVLANANLCVPFGGAYYYANLNAHVQAKLTTR